MQGSSLRRPDAVLLPLLAVLLLSAPVNAQVPESPSSDEFYKANVLPQQGGVELEFLGSASVDVTIEDASGTQATLQNESPPRPANKIYLDAHIVGNNTDGWVASITPPKLTTTPGDTHQARLNIQAGATIQNPEVEVQITAVYDPARSSEDVVTNASVLAVAKTFPRVSMQMGELPPSFSPDELQRIPMEVQNTNYYPDMVSFKVTGPDDWMVSAPSSIQLGPGETRTVYVDVKAPENPWFLYTTKSKLISVEAISETSGQTLVSVGVPVTEEGSTFPGWVAPHALLLVMGAALITKRRRRKRREARLEKGKPSYPGLDPEHEAELEVLKIEDPEEAEDVEARLETLYEQRKEAWKEFHERRQAAEDELEETYRERHEALVEARLSEGQEDPEARRRRRRLLEKKRELLERKKQALTGDPGSQSEGSEASAEGEE